EVPIQEMAGRQLPAAVLERRQLESRDGRRDHPQARQPGGPRFPLDLLASRDRAFDVARPARGWSTCDARNEHCSSLIELSSRGEVPGASTVMGVVPQQVLEQRY